MLALDGPAPVLAIKPPPDHGIFALTTGILAIAAEPQRILAIAAAPQPAQSAPVLAICGPSVRGALTPVSRKRKSPEEDTGWLQEAMMGGDIQEITTAFHRLNGAVICPIDQSEFCQICSVKGKKWPTAEKLIRAMEEGKRGEKAATKGFLARSHMSVVWYASLIGMRALTSAKIEPRQVIVKRFSRELEESSPIIMIVKP